MLTPLTSPLLTAAHGFFSRQGGVSTGIYGSLQTGWGARDDTPHNVAENRARVAAALGVPPERLISEHQHHSATALRVVEPWDPADAPEADGMATATPGLALGVLAADCAPILLEDAAAGVVGACHAGWKGALGGVIAATIAEMTGLGAARDRIRAAIGPCIGPDWYEVGPEYAARFAAADPANARFFRPSPHSAADAGRALFDLPAYCLDRLRAEGVADAQWIGRCTYAEPDLFFSNRRALHRGEGDYGRLISAIVLDPR